MFGIHNLSGLSGRLVPAPEFPVGEGGIGDQPAEKSVSPQVMHQPVGKDKIKTAKLHLTMV